MRMTTQDAPAATDLAQPAIEAIDVSRSYGQKKALDGVSLSVSPGEIHALLGPNGAGKTTLVRVLTGLADPDVGQVSVLGRRRLSTRESRALLGLVPSGDRTFYMRISGFENLLFFGRLHGLRKERAAERARKSLLAVGLEGSEDLPVGQYSHGMQKRLSIARALLVEPPVLFVDEATHDLDPAGARRVRDLVAEAASHGTAVVWTTQRIDEIRGFADRVTVLREGKVRFSGTVPALMSMTTATRFLVRLRSDDDTDVLARARSALGTRAALAPGTEADGAHFMLSLHEDLTIGHAAALLDAAGVQMLACREERSAVEAAFLFLTEEEGTS